MVLIVCYLVLARRITFRLHSTLVRMETLLEEANQHQSQQQDGIPPLRISLRKINDFAHLDADVPQPLLSQLENRLRSLSFAHVGDFHVSEDLEQLRLYLSGDANMIAAIRKPVHSRLYAEFCMDLGGGRIAGVGNPAIGSLIPTDTSLGKHFSESFDYNVPLLSRMWLEAKEMVDQLDCRVIDRGRVADFFETAHATEMDWRMANGGVTKQEVTAAFLAQGIIATRHDVEAIQERWQNAIDAYVLKHANASGPRDQLFVVHDHSIPSHVRKRLASQIDRAPSDHQPTVTSGVCTNSSTTESLLENMLALFPVREAVARLRPHLPEPSRFQFIKQTTQPFEADIYRLARDDRQSLNS